MQMMVLSACNNEHRLLPPLPCQDLCRAYVRAPNRHGMHARFVSLNRSQGLQPFPRPRVQRRAIIGHRSDEAKPEGQEPEKESRHTTRSADRTRAAPTMLLTVWKLFLLMLNRVQHVSASAISCSAAVADEVASKMEGLQLELGACRGSGHGMQVMHRESRVNMERLPIIQTDLRPVQQRRLRVGDKTPKNHCSSFRRQDNEAQSYTKHRRPLRGKDAEVQRQELLTLVQDLRVWVSLSSTRTQRIRRLQLGRIKTRSLAIQ